MVSSGDSGGLACVLGPLPLRDLSANRRDVADESKGLILVAWIDRLEPGRR